MISSQKQLLRTTAQVADRESKHAIQAVEAVDSIFFVEMNYGLRVGVRTKTMPQFFEFTAQIGEVVDFAVVGDPHCAIFVRHGHVATGREVENGKAPAP